MDIKLPRLGEGAESGTVVSILVKAGDQVKEGQTIVELENEKAVAPIPASASGRVAKLYVKEGDKLSAGQPILSLDTDGAPSAAPAPAAPREGARPTTTAVATAQPTPRQPVEAPSVDVVSDLTQNESIAASPTVRRLANELGIDLTRVRGSQHGGRVAVEDLRAYIQQIQRMAFEGRTTPATSAAPAPKAPAVEKLDFEKWGPVSRKPVSSLRKIIAQRMHESWSSVPRVTQFDEADITGIVALRKKYVPKYEKKGASLTLTPFLIRAVVAALKKYPVFNSSLDEATDEIVFKDYYHMGIAVDTEQGLIVPVIRDVDKKSLLQLSKELAELAEKTRQRKVATDDLRGGTFTISNQGGIGGGFFTPIVNKPEVAILGVGRGALKPVVRGAKIEKRMLLPLGLSYDHRVVDGATAARFIVEIVQALEQFKESEVKI
jgi:pyruvate dehydrogenase E2 component (dihydrolipoamide acetyltransferase)